MGLVKKKSTASNAPAPPPDAAAREQMRRDGVHRPLWKSRPLWVMGLFTILSGAFWVYTMVTGPEPAARGGGAQAHSLTAAPAGEAAQGERRFIDSAAPATVRIGASFIVGFLVAWVFRRFIKWTLLIAGALAIGIFALKKTGLIDLPWESVEQTVDESVEVAKREAGRVKEFLTNYAPSTMSALVGGFFGFRSK